MSENLYQPSVLESKWQKAWDVAKVFEIDEDSEKKKYFLLEMLPYPSGRIHMGHVRNYSIGDVAVRYKKMQGYAVLHPMGWDAFGMPAENAAIQRGIHPAKWTYENIDTMRAQLRRLGFSYDWRREFATCHPDYYRWEQLIFLKMFEKGAAYRKNSPINWCPKCATVLANEQAAGGVCWRCDSKVELRSMEQWYFRITDYTEELLRDIDDKLDGWPDRVRAMQREWIGKSEGAFIDFQVEGSSEKIRVFTTRPDTLFGVTFVSLAYEHPLVKQFAAAHGKTNEIQAFVSKSQRISHEDRLADAFEKEGAFTGAYCLHPFTGERIPVYAANFVLLDYGTGAVMAVPAHDQRDFEFAQKYHLPVKVVIQPSVEATGRSPLQKALTDEGRLEASGSFSGLSSAEAKKAIPQALIKQGLGGPATTYRLKDWCLSRQRYWGAPIPIIHCETCGAVPVPESELPVVLPNDVEFSGKGGSPLAKLESFINVPCPKCQRKAKRETDTMDTFVESSWYFFRYTSPKFNQGPFDRKKAEYWMPIDQYIGGIEHAAGHLIYCRYFTKVLRDLGLISIDEPAKNLMTQGMVVKDGAKMSKSKGNVVDPDEMIVRYGADSVRLFSLFAAPPEKDLEWSDAGLEGASRFLSRVWRFVHQWKASGIASSSVDRELEQWQHRTIKRVTDDIERWHFNTAIAALMEYLNYLMKRESFSIPKEAVATLVMLISPFAPHVADELWSVLGHKGFLIEHTWPSFDERCLQSEEMQIMVQVNGKLRDQFSVPVDADENTVKAQALALEKVIKHVEGKPVKKIIYVPKKLINIVV